MVWERARKKKVHASMRCFLAFVKTLREGEVSEASCDAFAAVDLNARRK